MGETLENLSLKTAQIAQILDQYRGTIYTLELKMNLLVKMMEEKGIYAIEEFNKRWPIYLKNNIGVVGQDGIMEGSLKINFWNEA